MPSGQRKGWGSPDSSYEIIALKPILNEDCSKSEFLTNLIYEYANSI